MEFPERAGAECWKSCAPITKDVEVMVSGQVKLQNRVIRYQRDFAGTCWETCYNGLTGEKFPNCDISWWRVKTDVNAKGEYTLYHTQGSYINTHGTSQSITNFNKLIRCPENFEHVGALCKR